MLITNDDGVRSPGIAALAGALAGVGHDVIVVAPLLDHSGYGTAIGPLHVDGQVAYERIELGIEHVTAFGVDGPPALAAMCGVLRGFGERPELVLSGINAGANTGRAVLHSGTVGAAMTAAQLGVPGVAVSLELADDRQTWHWDTAAVVATAVVASLPDRVSEDEILNVNVPNRPLGALAGVCPAEPVLGGTVQAVFGEPAEGVLQLALDHTVPAQGTDEALLASGWVTVSRIRLPRVLEGAADEWLGGLHRLVRVPTVA